MRMNVQKDIMEFFAKYSQNGHIVASSLSDFTDAAGDNPPHRRRGGSTRRLCKPATFSARTSTQAKNRRSRSCSRLMPLDWHWSIIESVRTGPAALGAAVAQAKEVLGRRRRRHFDAGRSNDERPKAPSARTTTAVRCPAR